jgi:hypothetical protein
MKIKEQTRKLAAQAGLKYGKAKLMRFEEIFEEYKLYHNKLISEFLI